jgi:Flp pilus assembly protein TadB
MRLALVLAIAVALLTPAGASAGPRSRNSKCEWIARQLVRADAMKVRAAEIDDELGVDRFEKRIRYLEDHFEEKCPEQAAQQKNSREFAALVRTAASAALSYFTFGAY